MTIKNKGPRRRGTAGAGEFRRAAFQNDSNGRIGSSSENRRGGFRTKNRTLADMAMEIAAAENPITLRGLFYRVVSAGGLPSTAKVQYRRLGCVVTRLREQGDMPMSWIVDHCRSTMKPSSWSGLADFAESVKCSYRKSLWAGQTDYIEFLIEKDAIAGTLYPITSEYDVALRVCRGYSSLSFAGEIAQQWAQIEKPITAYYIGDYDPSGFDIERDLREKLCRYSGKRFDWQRLAVTEQDFDLFDLLPLEVKGNDTRAKAFHREHGQQCAEVDAIPPSALRARVAEFILAHVDLGAWERLQAVEAAEKQTLDDFAESLATLPAEKNDLDSLSDDEVPW